MLDLILEKYGVEINLPMPEPMFRRGDTIIVLGDLSISKDDLSNLYRKFKVKQKMFEFVEYDDVTNYNFDYKDNQETCDLFYPFIEKCLLYIRESCLEEWEKRKYKQHTGTLSNFFARATG